MKKRNVLLTFFAFFVASHLIANDSEIIEPTIVQIHTPTPTYTQAVKGIGMGLISLILWANSLVCLKRSLLEGWFLGQEREKTMKDRLFYGATSGCLMIPAFKTGSKSLEYLKPLLPEI